MVRPLALYSSIGGFRLYVAGYGWNFADGLRDTSNCYCLPAEPGGSWADVANRVGIESRIDVRASMRDSWSISSALQRSASPADGLASDGRTIYTSVVGAGRVLRTRNAKPSPVLGKIRCMAEVQ